MSPPPLLPELIPAMMQMLPHQRVHRSIPFQDNHCDCGLFLLTYLEYFVHARPPALSKDAVMQAGKKKDPLQG